MFGQSFSKGLFLTRSMRPTVIPLKTYTWPTLPKRRIALRFARLITFHQNRFKRPLLTQEKRRIRENHCTDEIRPSAGTRSGFTYYSELLDAGCLIYRYYQGFYHVKALIIDDHLSIIGTANFDKRSLFLNEEVNVEIDDEAFTSEVYATIEEDMKSRSR